MKATVPATRRVNVPQKPSDACVYWVFLSRRKTNNTNANRMNCVYLARKINSCKSGPFSTCYSLYLNSESTLILHHLDSFLSAEPPKWFHGLYNCFFCFSFVSVFITSSLFWRRVLGLSWPSVSFWTHHLYDNNNTHDCCDICTTRAVLQCVNTLLESPSAQCSQWSPNDRLLLLLLSQQPLSQWLSHSLTNVTVWGNIDASAVMKRQSSWQQWSESDEWCLTLVISFSYYYGTHYTVNLRAAIN